MSGHYYHFLAIYDMDAVCRVLDRAAVKVIDCSRSGACIRYITDRRWLFGVYDVNKIIPTTC